MDMEQSLELDVRTLEGRDQCVMRVKALAKKYGPAFGKYAGEFLFVFGVALLFFLDVSRFRLSCFLLFLLFS